MAKEKHLSARSAQACRELLEAGATKKHLAKALDMTVPTLNRKLERDELEQYRAQDTQRKSKICEIKDLKRKQA